MGFGGLFTSSLQLLWKLCTFQMDKYISTYIYIYIFQMETIKIPSFPSWGKAQVSRSARDSHGAHLHKSAGVNELHGYDQG